MRIVFFGTSNVALPILEALKEKHELAAVVTAPDARVGRKQALMESPVAVLAKELKIPVLKPDSVKGNNELIQQLESIKADVFVVVSYGKILPQKLIDLPKLKTLNVHFSLLPEYRGASPIQAALLDGKNQTGTTIFILDADLDHGPILANEPSVIEPDDTFITLSQRLAHQSARLLVNTLYDYAEGKIVPKTQDHAKATYCQRITKAEGKIKWGENAQQAYNKFRAFYPWPGIWTTWNGQVLKILDCQPITPPNLPLFKGRNLPSTLSPLDKGELEGVIPGTVLPDGSIAAGNNTALKIKKLQLAGKQPVAIKDFINGYRDFVGSKLS